MRFNGTNNYMATDPKIVSANGMTAEPQKHAKSNGAPVPGTHAPKATATNGTNGVH